jgi:replicative DNA helicase
MKTKLSQQQIESTILWQLMHMDWKEQKKKIYKIRKKTMNYLKTPLNIIEQNVQNKRNTDWEEFSPERNKYRKKIEKHKSNDDYEIDYLIIQLEKNYRKKKFKEVKKDIENYFNDFELSSKNQINEIMNYLSFKGQKLHQEEKVISSVETLNEMLEKIDNKDDDQKESFIKTGIEEFDNSLNGGGFETGTLTILAARPSMGKSTLAYNLYFAQRIMGYQAHYISLEGNFKKHINPVFSSIACSINPDLPDWDKNHFNRTRIESLVKSSEGKNYREKYKKIAEYLDEEQIVGEWIHDKTREIGYKTDIQNLFDTLRALPEDTEIVYIDHLHEYDTSSRYQSSREKLEKIVSTVKNIAQQKDIAIVLLAQLNRNSVNSNRKTGKEKIRRPVMSDLKSSGAIEQEADNVIMLYRESYQLSEKDIAIQGIEDVTLEVLIRKQKTGGPAAIELYFDLKKGFIREYVIEDDLAKISDLSKEENIDTLKSSKEYPDDESPTISFEELIASLENEEEYEQVN